MTNIAPPSSQPAGPANGIFPVDTSVKVPTGHANGTLKVAILGDSVGGNMYESLAEYRTSDILPIDVTNGGCGIFDADSSRSSTGYVVDTTTLCWPWKDKLRTANHEHQPDVYVLHNLWDANDQLLSGAWVGPGTKEWQDQYRSQLELLVSIGEESGRSPLILLSNDRSRDENEYLSRERLDQVNSIAAEISEKYPNVMQLDFEAAVCPDGTCQSEDGNGRPIYRDGAHFSPTGLALLAPWLENQIAQALQSDKS